MIRAIGGKARKGLLFVRCKTYLLSGDAHPPHVGKRARNDDDDDDEWNIIRVSPGRRTISGPGGMTEWTQPGGVYRRDTKINNGLRKSNTLKERKEKVSSFTKREKEREIGS